MDFVSEYPQAKSRGSSGCLSIPVIPVIDFCKMGLYNKRNLPSQAIPHRLRASHIPPQIYYT
jgi:hypothetical protein